MGSVLVLRPNNLSMASRLAHEGSVVRVLGGPESNNGNNPKRINAAKFLDQYDFALVGEHVTGAECEKVGRDCKVLGSGQFNHKLKEEQYFLAVAGLTDMVPAWDEVPGGIDLDMCLWFDGKEFVHIGYYISHLRMFERDKGPVTDGVAFVLWKAHPSDTLVDKVTGLTKLLVDLEFAGPLTLKCVVTEDHVCLHEMSACFSTRHVLWHELVRDGMYQFLLTLDPQHDKVHVIGDYAVGVMAQRLDGPPQLVMNSGAEKHCFGDVVTARGYTLHEAKRRVYRTLREVTTGDPETFYRGDVTASVEEKIVNLKMWGWLNA